jgi:hypothetical protein
MQEKQERTKRTMVSRRMPTPSQMPDEYAERRSNSVQSHTAMVKQLWGIGWLLARWKEGNRVKEIWEFETGFFSLGSIVS